MKFKVLEGVLHLHCGAWVPIELDWNYSSDRFYIEGIPCTWDGHDILMELSDFAQIINSLARYRNKN
jgi:hypothetical protein